jgi:predicted transposase YdaD
VPKPFDATTKHLVTSQPADWLEYVGLPRASVEVIEADLATVTAAADMVLRVRTPTPYLVHLEFQANYDRELAERLLQYNVLLRRRHRLPVHSVVLLLRPRADGPALTGDLHLHLPDRPPYLTFSYEVVRAWRKPVTAVLAGGLAALPMAPLAEASPDALPEVIRQMEARIAQEASPDEAGVLWTATYVLMGLRYSRKMATALLRGVRAMKESVTYQAIVDEGRAEGRITEARAILLRQGQKRFGPPTAEMRAALEAITSIERLELLAERLLDVESWQELLAG